jgi:hypothetical protein
MIRRVYASKTLPYLPPVPGVSAVSPVYAQVEVRYNVPYGARRAINPLYIATTNAITIPPS